MGPGTAIIWNGTVIWAKLIFLNWRSWRLSKYGLYPWAVVLSGPIHVPSLLLPHSWLSLHLLAVWNIYTLLASQIWIHSSLCHVPLFFFIHTVTGKRSPSELPSISGDSNLGLPGNSPQFLTTTPQWLSEMMSLPSSWLFMESCLLYLRFPSLVIWGSSILKEGEGRCPFQSFSAYVPSIKDPFGCLILLLWNLYF